MARATILTRRLGIVILLLQCALISTAQDSGKWKLTGNSDTDTSHFLGTIDSARLVLRANNTPAFWMLGNGMIGIGDSINRDGYRLAVRGSMMTEKLTIKLLNTWPDYVFDSLYQLPSLQQVEKHYRRYGHLPGVPSAKEVDERGLDMNRQVAVLLKKVEELTLYITQQKKRSELLSTKIKNLLE